MAPPTTLSREAARSLVLASMGLDRPPKKRATKRSVLDAIRRMGALQIDTIHVVARSPYLVLWSRIGDFRQVWLEQLLAERHLFEYWSHEACFLPIEDFPLYRRLMLDGAKGWKSTRRWIAEHPEPVRHVLDYIRENGPTRSADFERKDKRKGGWWSWKPEKMALEHLFNAGTLVIVGRQNFHRVYDLRERALPDWDDRQTPSAETVQNELAIRAVRALGIATPRWAADYFRTPKPGAAARLESLADRGSLLRVEVEEIKEPAYVHPDNRRLLSAAAAGRIDPTVTTLLSPFDPLVWDRKRAETLFDFEYRIECYTPAPKRRYGYFTLPVLHRGALVGRIDPKAHRKDGVFEVKSLHLEPGVKPIEPLVSDLADALARLAAWHETPRVLVTQTNSPAMTRKLAAALRR